MRKARIYQKDIEIGQVLTLAYFGDAKPQVQEAVEVANNRDGQLFIGHVVSVGEGCKPDHACNYKVKVTSLKEW